MNVAGIGIVFSRGRGIKAYEEALQQGWVAPSRHESSPALGEPVSAYRVAPEILKDKQTLKGLRRADRFCKMAVLASTDAVHDSEIVLGNEKASLGIVVGTAFGPHATTFRFLDEILDYTETNVSPTLFSHAVHNAAASYISTALGSRGPALTLTSFALSFHHALLLAETWLREGRCNYVLAGSVDECHPVLEYICARKLNIPQDGKISPFSFLPSPPAVPGEGSTFFLLTHLETPRKYCRITGISIDGSGAEESSPDIMILDTDGMLGDETIYQTVLKQDVHTAGFSPLFGSMMTGSAFHCAAGALMLQKQVRYSCPILDNPHCLKLCDKKEQADIQLITCVRFSCGPRKTVISLRQ
jgi:3-oxoacyl-[acyl-carrier-protein] synthase II